MYLIDIFIYTVHLYCNYKVFVDTKQRDLERIENFASLLYNGQVSGSILNTRRDIESSMINNNEHF